jgi:hypothetical protein
MPNPSTATTGSVEYVTVTTSSTLKVTGDPTCVGIRLRNTDATNSVWYSYVSPATTTTTPGTSTSVELAATKEVSLPFNGRLYVIAETASVVLMIERLRV